jgi:hypothetical protein
VIGRITDAAREAYTLYQKSGHANHLYSAIQGFQVALDQCPHGHPHRAAALSNLGHAILYGFTQGIRADIDHAISLFRSALMLRPREHPDHLLSILNLCQALHHRHSHRKSGADLREAAGLYHCLLPLCVEGSHLQLCAIEQCNALPMDPSDMSIALRRTVLEHCSLWPQHRARSLNRLAGDLHARFTQSCNIDHIHEAVDLSREALDICPDDGQRGFFFDVLSYYTFEWFRHRGYSRDECISLNRGGALRTHDRPDRRMTPLNTLPDALITRCNHYNNTDHRGANKFHREARDPRSNGLSTSLPPSRHSEERHYAGRGQPTRIHQQPSLNSSLSNRRVRGLNHIPAECTDKLQQIPNLAIFGDSTSGERSAMNVITQYQLGKTSSDAAGCISLYQRHEVVKLPGERFDLFYTAAQNQDIIPHLNQTGAKMFPGAFKYANTINRRV